jgi:hypothetical protein
MLPRGGLSALAWLGDLQTLNEGLAGFRLVVPPKSVVTAMAGFAPGSWEPASAAIAGSGLATGDPRPH